MLVERNSVGLRIALFVRRADANRMFPGLGFPIKIPADPSGGNVGLPEPGRLPVLALAQTVLHCRDLPERRPGPAAKQAALCADFPTPRKLQRALQVLVRKDGSLGRGLGLVVGPDKNVGVGIPVGERGFSETSIRPTHLMLATPIQPGTRSRTGNP